MNTISQEGLVIYHVALYLGAIVNYPSIDIFEFTDHREYLLKIVSEKGLRAFARKCELRSPAILTMIIQGKRGLTPKTAIQLAQGLTLKGRRRQYLMALSQLSMSRTASERTRAQEVMLRLRNYRAEHSLEIEQYEFLSTWYYPVIYAMTGTQGFVRDDQAIAKSIGKGIVPSQVAAAFDLLIRLGLIIEKDGRLQQTQGAISTREEIASAAIHKYHQQMLDQAKSALDLPLDQREFSGLTVPVPSDVLPEVKARIRKFRKELNEYLSQFNTPAEVYQLNLQFFPFTRGSL